MIFSKSHYGWVSICSLLLSCASSMKTLVLPQGLDNTFRSGEINHPILKTHNVNVLDYRVISDSVIQVAAYDTTLTFGIIFPRSSLVVRVQEKKMDFGSDSLQCSIRYTSTNIQMESADHSVLSAIIVNPGKNDPNYDPYRDKIMITPYKRKLSGSILLPQLNEEWLFCFEHQKADKNFDTACISGYMKYGLDSFFIMPLYKEDLSRGKNAKPMQILQGYCLMKGDSLCAFLQHAPLIKIVFEPGLKDVLFLNTKISPAEQLVVTAYFFLVSRLVFTTSNEVLY